MDITTAVETFTKAVGCTTDQFNVRQHALYFGLQAEEFAEKLQALCNAGTGLSMPWLAQLTDDLNHLSTELKRGTYDLEVGRADRQEFVDADVDLTWVTLGALFSQGADVRGACGEVARSNLSKIGPDGVVLKDENGKVKKSQNYSPPDLSSFICKD